MLSECTLSGCGLTPTHHVDAYLQEPVLHCRTAHEVRHHNASSPVVPVHQHEHACVRHSACKVVDILPSATQPWRRQHPQRTEAPMTTTCSASEQAAVASEGAGCLRLTAQRWRCVERPSQSLRSSTIALCPWMKMAPHTWRVCATRPAALHTRRACPEATTTHALASTQVCELPFSAKSSDQLGGAGGTCVIRGCVPKKLLVFGAHFAEDFKDSRGFGWRPADEGRPAHDWPALIAAKDAEIARLSGVYGKILANAGVTVRILERCALCSSVSD